MDKVSILKQLGRVERNMNHWAKNPAEDESISMMFVSLTLVSNLVKDLESDLINHHKDIESSDEIYGAKWLAHVIKFEGLFNKGIENFKCNEIEVLIYSMLPKDISEVKAYIELLKNIEDDDLNKEIGKIKKYRLVK